MPRKRPADRELDQIVLADAGHPDRAVDRGVHLVGAIDAQRASARPGPVLLPSQSSARSRMVSTAASVADEAESWITPEKPSGRPSAWRSQSIILRLELGRRRRGLPQHALRGHRRDQIFGHDRDRRGIGREIGEEARMLPMRHARHDRLLEIGEDRRPSARPLRAATRRSARRCRPAAVRRAPACRAASSGSRRPSRRRGATTTEIRPNPSTSPRLHLARDCSGRRLQPQATRCWPLTFRKIRQALKGRSSARSTSRPRSCGNTDRPGRSASSEPSLKANPSRRKAGRAAGRPTGSTSASN